MKYTKFVIKNFKGIRDTTINLQEIAGASVFALVGLNESGKTTLLEAIYSFSPDSATSELLGGRRRDRCPAQGSRPQTPTIEFYRRCLGYSHVECRPGR